LWKQEPADAMRDVKRRIQPKLDRMNERWEKVKDKRMEEWGRSL
jgi:hypothetical protein